MSSYVLLYVWRRSWNLEMCRWFGWIVVVQIWGRSRKRSFYEQFPYDKAAAGSNRFPWFAIPNGNGKVINCGWRCPRDIGYKSRAGIRGHDKWHCFAGGWHRKDGKLESHCLCYRSGRIRAVYPECDQFPPVGRLKLRRVFITSYYLVHFHGDL